MTTEQQQQKQCTFTVSKNHKQRAHTTAHYNNIHTHACLTFCFMCISSSSSSIRYATHTHTHSHKLMIWLSVFIECCIYRARVQQRRVLNQWAQFIYLYRVLLCGGGELLRAYENFSKQSANSFKVISSSCAHTHTPDTTLARHKQYWSHRT